MTRFSLALASVLALSGSAFAYTAPMPTKAQQKQVTAQIQHNVSRTAWYKSFKAAGQKPTLTVSYGKGQGVQGMIGSGFPTATAMVSAGNNLYGGAGQNPQKSRQFVVAEGASGKFKASGGTWHQVYTVTAPTSK